MNLTPYFTWDEARRSETADREGIDNSIPNEFRFNVVRTAQFLECVRHLLGGDPITVTSWYRCPDLNAAIGGSERSVHPKGLAADVKTLTNLEEAFDKIAHSDLPFDQLIMERTRSGSHWLHVGLSQDAHRRQVLRAEGDALGGAMTFRRIAEG